MNVMKASGTEESFQFAEAVLTINLCKGFRADDNFKSPASYFRVAGGQRDSPLVARSTTEIESERDGRGVRL